MDVTCATCGEPWDTYHLRHDEVHETDAGLKWIHHRLDCEDHDRKMLQCEEPTPPDIEEWEGKLTPFWRAEFSKRGWVFGGSVSAVIRCPHCKGQRALPDAEERAAHRLMIAELLDGDEDGIDVELEDLASMERQGWPPNEY